MSSPYAQGHAEHVTTFFPRYRDQRGPIRSVFYFAVRRLRG